MRRLCTALLLAWTALAVPVGAQEKKTVTLPFDGPEFFCHILNSERLQPLNSFAQAQGDARDSMIVIFGNPKPKDVLRFTKNGLGRYLQQGGNLLIATDQPLSLDALSIKITGHTVNLPEEECYRRNEDCPFLGYVTPTVGGPRDVRDHPLFNLLHQGVATNCPSYIHFDEPPDASVERLLIIPDKFGFHIFIYMAGSPKNAKPAGRVLVVAWHGMFMNGMMLQPDNDNFGFAINTVRWLREGPEGAKRSKALFVVDGRIITDFDMNLAPPPPQIPMPTIAMLNRLIRGLEDEGFFHWAFEKLLGEHFKHVAPFLIALTTGVLLLYGAKKFLEGRHLHDTAVPAMVGAQTVVGPATPRGEQRQHALLRQKDHWESSRLLVQQWFQRELGIAPERWAGGGVAAFHAAGSFLTRGRLQRRADFVLMLAQTADPIKVSRSDFAALVQSLPKLSQAFMEGRLVLLLDGKEVRQTHGIGA